MLSSPRNSTTHNQQAKLAVDYNELLKELSSHEMTSVGCYTIGETIGEGTFGKVKKGTHKLTGRLVAIKKISKQHAPMMAREIHHHRQLKHPNIVMLYEMITTESAIHVISEYCPNGDLLDALTDSGRCCEIRVHKWFHQLTDAIKYCHTRGIVHRDLKLENILLDADDNVKICDFGFARYAQKNQYLETFCGSLSYSAPEVILRNKYTGPETDIWSLGVILYTLLAGEYPFDDDSEIMTQRKIVQVEYEMPFYFSSDLCDLIQRMLRLNPSDRLTIELIQDHAWMNHYYSEIEDDEEEEEACLTPSSSTTTNQSTSDVDSIFSQNENTIAMDDSLDFHHISPDLKFSPQVRSSLGILRPSQQQQQQLQNKSPRFSAPTLNRRHNNTTFPLSQPSFRTSLPSSFSYNREMSEPSLSMTPIEQRLFAALTAAGFDRDALIKMQTGECDTSSTLWHLLLENMSVHSQKSPTISSVPDAFASAMQSRNDQIIDSTSSLDLATTNDHLTTKQTMDRAIQTRTSKDADPISVQPALEPIQLATQYVQPYPKPPTDSPKNTIHTVGFGSTTAQSPYGKSGWFSSVKSWFGSTKQQQNDYMKQQQQQQQQRSRSSSNCSTMSSPISSPSSYRNFDQQQQQLKDDSVMSPPVYRTGSQKHRRRVLQLSEPPVSELDQLTYNGTTTTAKQQPNRTTRSSGCIPHYYTPQYTPSPLISSPPPTTKVNMPPTALTSCSTTRFTTDTFSILTSASQAKEIDICEKRYSIMYNSNRQKQQQQHQPTPPPSPPTNRLQQQQQHQEQPKEEENNLSVELPISPMDERTLMALSSSASIVEETAPTTQQLSDFSSDSSSSDSEEEHEFVNSNPIKTSSLALQPYSSTPLSPPQPPPPVDAASSSSSSLFNNTRPRSSRFVPRSRLSIYGMQEPRSTPMGSKAIIEEEEEEDE